MNNEIRPYNKLSVILDTCGNIDHNQDPNRSLPNVRSGAVKCESLAEASILCKKYIDKHNLGAGNWCDNAGIVLNENKKVIARISYNGRIWDIKGNEMLSLK